MRLLSLDVPRPGQPVTVACNACLMKSEGKG